MGVHSRSVAMTPRLVLRESEMFMENLAAQMNDVHGSKSFARLIH